MRFLVIFQEVDCGGDHSIGNGVAMAEFEAEDIEAAKLAVASPEGEEPYQPAYYGLTVKGCGGPYDGHLLERALIFPLTKENDITKNVKDAILEEKHQRDLAENQTKEKAERAEFEKLKRKYG